jgi:ParB-like chromosome segregation protein Spo0J
MKSESDNLVPISSMKAPITNLTLKIIKEYQDLVPHQSKQEYHELIHSLKVNGFWEHCPIVISEEGIILDGRHHWWACQELGIEPKVIVKSFNDKLQEKLFVIDCNHRGRRHLSIFQRIELQIDRKPILQEIAKKNQSLGGKGVQI